MLLLIAIILLILWAGGFTFHVAGGLIHIHLVFLFLKYQMDVTKPLGLVETNPDDFPPDWTPASPCHFRLQRSPDRWDIPDPQR